tara:strand:- start:313 stop:852 length:540 start_codon:yes stop_codon:yes gene_type:complete
MAEKFISPMNTVSDPDLGEQEFSDEEFESIGLSFMKLIKEAEETNQGQQPISQTGQGMGGTSAPPRKSLQQVHERIQGIRDRHSGQSKAPMKGNALQALVDQTQQRSTGMQQQGQQGMQRGRMRQPAPMQGMQMQHGRQPMQPRYTEAPRPNQQFYNSLSNMPGPGMFQPFQAVGYGGQ